MSLGKLGRELAPQQVLSSLTQRHLVLFCVPDFSGVFPGAQEEEEAAGGVPWGFVLLMQSRGWLRNVGSGAVEPQGSLTTESPGICSDLGICPKRRDEEMLS